MSPPSHRSPRSSPSPRCRAIPVLVAAAALAMPISAVAQTNADAEYRSYLAHVAAAESSLRLNDTAAALRWLDAAPGDHAAWEWKHLRARCDDSLRTLAEAGVGINELAYSPDGSRFAVAGDDGLAAIHDSATGEALASLAGHEGRVYRIAFSPDGRIIATAGADRTARTFDAVTGEPIATYTGMDTPITGVSFSPDGTRVASCNYTRLSGPPHVMGTVRIWNPRTGEEIAALNHGGVKPISMARFSPDGSRIAASSWDGIIFIWDVASPESEPRAITFPDEGVYNALNCVAWSPDGSTIVAGSKDRTLRAFGAATGEPLGVARHGAWVTACAYTPDGAAIVTACDDNLVRVLDSATLAEKLVLRGHTEGVEAAAVRPDASRVITAGADGRILEWNPALAETSVVSRKTCDTSYWACFTPDGTRAFTAAYDGRIEEWDAARGWKRLRAWEAHPGSTVHGLSMSADGSTLISCSWDKSVRIWDTNTTERTGALDHAAGVYSAAISPDGRLVAAALRDRSVVVWEVATRTAIQTLGSLPGGVYQVSFSPDSSLLAACLGNGSAFVWKTDDWTYVYTPEEPRHAGSTMSCAFSPDGRFLATAGADGVVILRPIGKDAPGGWSGRIASRSVERVSFSPDGSRIIAAADHLYLLDAATGEPLLTLRHHNDSSWFACFDPAGERILSVSYDGTLGVVGTRPARDRVAGGE